jgi:hypothetical protein
LRRSGESARLNSVRVGTVDQPGAATSITSGCLRFYLAVQDDQGYHAVHGK